MRVISFIVLVLIVVFQNSCKHTYIASGNKLLQLAEDAQLPGKHKFYVRLNGDTVNVNEIREQKVKSGKIELFMDGKMIVRDSIRSYQDGEIYYELFWGNEYIRLYRGKINLLIKYDVNQWQRSSIPRAYYFQRGLNFEQITVASAEDWLKDYTPALEYFRKEYPRPKKYMDDYKAFVRILKVYDQREGTGSFSF
jgi:hypothetical protein